MPTYEYRCRDCGHTFDVVQAMSDETLTVCPVCGGELRKVFAPPAISFHIGVIPELVERAQAALAPRALSSRAAS